MDEISKKINKTYLDTFGRTSLNERLRDILGEATELARFVG